ncbi:MAG TPA: response regulator transcription factor [Burkholderiales bacterium]
MVNRVLVVEDQRIVREMLITLLAGQPDIHIVGEASSGAGALHLAAQHNPDLVLLDIGLPDMDGVAVMQLLHREHPATRVIALSVHDEPYIVHAMMDAGAAGYVLKGDTVHELQGAIRAVARGESYWSRSLAPAAQGGPAPHARQTVSLGARERQVLARLAEGKRSAEIAKELHISVATVDVHRRNIMRKLDLHTVAELTKFALREGLTSL